ncbi:DNA-directed RNA polymerase [Candidatus Woesearchaeota archaeon]|nr:DNA-directed RNA polymerase [Candidatus Woesearchaeota archaeon]
MYYTIKVKGHVRVDPKLFSLPIEKALQQSLNGKFEGYISKDLGVVIGVSTIDTIGEGVVISGDGAAYYETHFSVLSFKPEVGEVVLGRISDITDFGAFMILGPIDGMIHVSQTMDDFVSFAKSNVLTGKDTKRNLKVGDQCLARVIAVSYKDVSSPKIGLTMRQHRLGALNWIEDDIKKEKKGKGKE